jgi:ABC-type sugar transport system substrate-binding protein
MVSRIKTIASNEGIEINFHDSENDPSSQISAVENFIYSGCNVIIIQALDADAMAPKAKEAMEKGIKVIAYGIGLEYYDCWYKNDNYLVGQTVGSMAAEWINKNYEGKAKVGLIEFPLVSVLIDRAKGIEDALNKQCPGAKIIARGAAIDSESRMKLGENFLQQDPEIQVIVSISDGPALGAYEAIKVAGRDNENFAIFGSDTSPIALANIKAGTCYRGTVDCDSFLNAPTVIEIAQKLVKNEQPDSIVVMGANPVTILNATDFVY